MTRTDWLGRFEKFLASIPVADYRQELLPIKTVEQDLPRDLNPLAAIYTAYWQPTKKQFPDFESFFQHWWQTHLSPLDTFIRKYFWGCSFQFAHLGFKARIYRTLISLLTQFHFCYSWLAHCTYVIEASAELDMQGIDALVRAGDTKVIIQIKKETYRTEAREGGRFARRKMQTLLLMEVPYTIIGPDEWKKRADRALTNERRREAQLFASLAGRFQRWLPNGFVVFQPQYVQRIEEIIKCFMDQRRQGVVGWRDTLELLEGSLIAE